MDAFSNYPACEWEKVVFTLMAIECSIEASLREIKRAFLARNLTPPRRITLNYHDFETLKESVRAVVHHTDPLDAPRFTNDELMIYGLKIDRIPCTCGAL